MAASNCRCYIYRLLLNGSRYRYSFSSLERARVPSRKYFRAKTLASSGVFRRFASTVARRSSLLTQFDEVKAQYKDYLLLFQVGDFYELYGKDAELVGDKTSLKVTKRQGVSMAGFPVKALDEWLKTLVEAEFQLAICNQKGYGYKSVLYEHS